MLSKIFHASYELIFWLSSSHLVAFDFPELTESFSYEVFFRRQLNNNYAMYLIFKALFRHKSSGCKSRYGKYFFCFALYTHASSLLLDSVMEQIELA